MSNAPITYSYIRNEGQVGRMGECLLAIVAEGDRGRVYLGPKQSHVEKACRARAAWKPDTTLPDNPRDFKTPNYGMATFGDLFTDRQLTALATFSDLVGEAIEKIRLEAIQCGLSADPKPLRDGGTGASAYAEAVALYLSFAVSKQAYLGNSLCRWEPVAQCPRQLFGRQAIPMIWDYAEGNPLGASSGSWKVFVEGIAKAFSKSFEAAEASASGTACQADAMVQALSTNKVISTDPPYYDNIGYADLSDFFYVWLRRSYKNVFPHIFSTLAVPKSNELVATPYRHGGKESAEAFFLDGMTKSIRRLGELAHGSFPVAIYYAFKQSEKKGNDDVASTGWETFLDAIFNSGFAVSGTWPMRTENTSRMIAQETNALASSIVLVCRRQAADAPTVSRREFVSVLRSELPPAITDLQRGNIAPVDLAQAAIGPGMSVYTRYALLLAYCCLAWQIYLAWHRQIRSEERQNERPNAG